MATSTLLELFFWSAVAAGMVFVSIRALLGISAARRDAAARERGKEDPPGDAPRPGKAA